MKVQPIEDRVLVLLEAVEETKTPSGLVLVEGPRRAWRSGTVVAVGPGRWDSGQRVAMQFAVGDKVLIDAYSDRPIRLDGEEYYLIGESEVLAILRE